jgi:thiol-disulfide isomerase/thioredoxin
MSLQDELDAHRAQSEARRPPEITAVMRKVTADLVASGQAGRALGLGALAPAFTLPGPDGKPIASADLLARGPLVITFYRGVWCPYCNMELQALQAALPLIEAAGASPPLSIQ